MVSSPVSSTPVLVGVGVAGVSVVIRSPYQPAQLPFRLSRNRYPRHPPIRWPRAFDADPLDRHPRLRGPSRHRARRSAARSSRRRATSPSRSSSRSDDTGTLLHAPAGRVGRESRDDFEAALAPGDRAVRDDAGSSTSSAARCARWCWSRPPRTASTTCCSASAPDSSPSTSRSCCATTPTCGELAAFYGVPFESQPVTDPEQKAAFEQRVLEVVTEHDIELVVLARYMQILSPELCTRARGSDHQHPPLVPARVQGREPVQAGARARREADRRHRPFRHERPRRGADHRAERGAGRPLAQRRRAGGHRPGRGVAHAHPGGEVVPEDRVLLDGARTIIFKYDRILLHSGATASTKLGEEPGYLGARSTATLIAASGSGLDDAPPALPDAERSMLGGARLVPGLHRPARARRRRPRLRRRGARAAGGARHAPRARHDPLGHQPGGESARRAARAARRDRRRSPRVDPLVLGSHLEGPFLAPRRRGAHNADFLRGARPRLGRVAARGRRRHAAPDHDRAGAARRPRGDRPSSSRRRHRRGRAHRGHRGAGPRGVRSPARAC